MKRFLKIMLFIMGSLLLVIVVFWFCISYMANYKKTTCDTSVSPDGTYELTLQAIGEPDWPFGSASGRLVLMEGKDKISQTDFELHNDGGSITSSCWKVTWYEDYVEVILSGEEQFDEQVILYFNGTKEIQQLTDITDIEVDDPPGEELDESQVITEQFDGYRAIYQQYFADEGCDFVISYSASGNSRVILNENEEIIEFLAYDRLSENEKCELYVLYRSKKNVNGSWYISEAEILDIFAYNVSAKDVVSSGKTSWSATGNEKYYEVTGEK